MDRLDELVHLSIGRASMCWSEIPHGVFNDVHAKRIGALLLQAIKEHELEAIEREKAIWRLSPPSTFKDARGDTVDPLKGDAL